MANPPPGWLAPANEIIREFEGCRLTAYPDPGTGGSPWTIGWGTTTYYDGQPVRQGDTISQELADAMLAGAIERTGQTIARAIPGWANLNASQQAALVSFSYNVGPNWFDAEGFRSITQAILEWRLQDVPAALLLYVNPGSPVEAGLRRRRQAEGRLWSTPVPGAPSAPTPAPDGPPVWPSEESPRSGGLVDVSVSIISIL